MGKYYSDDVPYRDPLLVDEKGLYITKAQMTFFLNRRRGKTKFETASREFMDYYNHCRLYNLIYDMLEDDPECATFFWDGEKNRVAVSFTVDGSVAKALAKAEVFLSSEDDDEDDDSEGDEYNLFD